MKTLKVIIFILKVSLAQLRDYNHSIEKYDVYNISHNICDILKMYN